MKVDSWGVTQRLKANSPASVSPHPSSDGATISEAICEKVMPLFRQFWIQIQPESSRRTIASITAMPSALSFRQGMCAKFVPPA